ncbi:RNA polymerase II elongation factor ELL2-like [Herpailurus yagouaroundi]|uniref:RNA polymerase II elongation factor ELL2-like n=1 Tax=Herpailurus yagouaroundi TaxID=1608482 RepID=UPI001AD681E7|nr:RNA polymerase II elongation factor ELL2-like [Puma yagouaroundi]
MDRYDYMAAHGGRVLGQVVHQEAGVSVEKVNGLEPRQDDVAVFPLQLTRPTSQALASYQNYENTAPPQAFLEFEGLEELIETPPNDSPTGKYRCNFLWSDAGDDSYGDQSQQRSSTYSPSLLSCLDSTEDKRVACDTTDCHQMTQATRPQAEEGSSNKWKNNRKLQREKRVPIRRAPRSVPDPVPERKRTAPINPAYTIRKSRVVNRVHMRPYRDRVIHLLALKAYKKSELLLRLQKDGITKDEENTLGEILQQVANLNTQNFSYTLKDYVFKEVHKDWPGYSELDRQSLELVLSRKADIVQPASDTSHRASSGGSATAKTLEDEFSNLAHINLSRKKVRISHVTTATQSLSSSHSVNTRAEPPVSLPPPSGATANVLPPPPPPTHLPLPNPPQPACASSNSSSFSGGPGTQDPGVHSFSRNRKIFLGQQKRHTTLETLPPTSVQRKYLKFKKEMHMMSYKKSKYKFREHKAEKQEHDTETMEEQKTDPDRRGESVQPNPNDEVEQVGTASGETWSASGCPDYLAHYVTVVSLEQRQHYAQEFRAEYDEYQALHTKMLRLSRIFTKLDFQRKRLSPDSKEYQEINKKISLEYEKMKWINPNYGGEKQRCQYLYNKLAHIKRLIKDYDQQQVLGSE